MPNMKAKKKVKGKPIKKLKRNPIITKIKGKVKPKPRRQLIDDDSDGDYSDDKYDFFDNEYDLTENDDTSADEDNSYDDYNEDNNKGDI
jgi:hypothetical protein